MALSKRAQEKLAADRAALAGNYLYKNRKTAVTWANANGQEGLTFVNKCNAYAHARGESAAYKNDVNAFNAVAVTYYKDPELTLADLLA